MSEFAYIRFLSLNLLTEEEKDNKKEKMNLILAGLHRLFTDIITVQTGCKTSYFSRAATCFSTSSTPIACCALVRMNRMASAMSWSSIAIASLLCRVTMPRGGTSRWVSVSFCPFISLSSIAAAW